MENKTTLANKLTTKATSIEIHEDGDHFFVELRNNGELGYTMLYAGKVKNSAYAAADGAFKALLAVGK